MLRRRVPAQSLRPMCVTSARHYRVGSLIAFSSNASGCLCSQPLSRRAEEILERLHALLPEDQRPELSRSAQEESSQHHEAGSRGPHAVSPPATPLTHRGSALSSQRHNPALSPARSAPSSPDVSPQSSPRPPRANNDRLTLLTRLVRKGEKKGLFVEKMPASIYQVKSQGVFQGHRSVLQRVSVVTQFH